VSVVGRGAGGSRDSGRSKSLTAISRTCPKQAPKKVQERGKRGQYERKNLHETHNHATKTLKLFSAKKLREWEVGRKTLRHTHFKQKGKKKRGAGEESVMTIMRL